MGRRSRLVVLVLVALLVVSGFVPGSVAGSAAQTGEERAFVVELDADGDATVTVRLVYDLADGGQEAAFDQLRADDSNTTARFERRMQRVADRTAAETGREMRVGDAEASVTTDREEGVVRLSVPWSNLAAVEGDRLIVTEPFASGFQPDRQFVLIPPKGSAVVETSVPPDAENDGQVLWAAGTDLSGFSVTTAPDGVTSESAPTPLAPTLVALVAGLLAYGGRRRLS